MQMGKVLGLVVGGLLALLALLLVSVWLFVNPNTYKPRIAAAVREATGRELVLEGDIHLSVFPWIALQLGPASLGNPPGFGGQPFASFKQATFRARLLPLLARRLEIGRVEIDGLDVRLVRNADGRGNWEGTETVAGTAAGMGAEGRVGTAGGEGMAGRIGTQAGTEMGGAGASPGAADNGHGFASIAGVKITNSRVSYGPYHAENINLETGAFANNEVVPVALTLDADRGVATEHATVQARFGLSADLTAKRYRVAALTIRSTVNMAEAARPVRWSLSTPILDVDVGGQTLNATQFELDLAGAHLSGSVAGSRIIDALALSGRGSLAPLVLREFLSRVGVTVPRTRDPKALSLVTASVAYGYGAGGVTLDDLQVTVDDAHVTGRVGILDLEKPDVTVALAVDGVDLDRYLAAAGDGAGTGTGIGAGSGSEREGGARSGNGNVHVSGRGAVNLKATGRGVGGEALLRSLNGRVDAVVTGGAVEGVDVGFQLARAEALLRGQSGAGVQDSHRTPFDVMKVSADIADGVARTHDLTIASPVLKVTGQGSVDLASQSIDLSLVADTLRTLGGAPIQIPLNVTGALADPTVRPDLEALAKGELRHRVQEVLEDKLKGLFNR